MKTIKIIFTDKDFSSAYSFKSTSQDIITLSSFEHTLLSSAQHSEKFFTKKKIKDIDKRFIIITDDDKVRLSNLKDLSKLENSIKSNI